MIGFWMPLLRYPGTFFSIMPFWNTPIRTKLFLLEKVKLSLSPIPVAFPDEKLEIKPGDKVLEIGTGSGYQACILLELGAKVIQLNTTKSCTRRPRCFYLEDGLQTLLLFWRWIKRPNDKSTLTIKSLLQQGLLSFQLL